MSFRLWIIFYVFALLAAAMATFGAGRNPDHIWNTGILGVCLEPRLSGTGFCRLGS